MMCLTATATKQMCREVSAIIGMNNPKVVAPSSLLLNVSLHSQLHHFQSWPLMWMNLCSTSLN